MDANAFVAAGRALAGLVAGSELREKWEEPSVLEGYSCGELAGHAARGVLLVEDYLHGPRPDPNAELIDAVGYFVSSLSDHDPIDSDFHIQVRKRAAERAAAGPDALVEKLTTAKQNLSARFFDDVDGDREIAVLGGLRMTMTEYLRTRKFELAIHTDDLALSLGVPTPPLPPHLWADVAMIAAGIAVARNGGMAVALGLTRRERGDRVLAI